MNIYDIAKKAGVSIATVSRVLNNSARVSEATRQRVLEAVESEDYQPNVFARGLMLNTMKTVGLMCQDASDPYMGAAINFLEDGLRGRDYEMLLCCTGPDPADKQKRLSQLMARKVDAVILIGSSFVEKTEEENRYLYQASQQVPILFLNGILNGENIYGCMSDDYKAVKHAVSYALGTGCRSPLFLYRADTMSAGRKKAGFISAVEDAGIPFSERMCCLSGRNAKEAAECLKALSQNHGVFDLVMAADDELAVGAAMPTAVMRCRNPRRDSLPAFTFPMRPRNSCSFIGTLPSLGHPSPAALAMLQDACNSRIVTGCNAVVNDGARAMG